MIAKYVKLGVPITGREAFYQGWDDSANPHDKDTPERVRWHADWWTANADTYEDHCKGDPR